MDAAERVPANPLEGRLRALAALPPGEAGVGPALEEARAVEALLGLASQHGFFAVVELLERLAPGKSRIGSAAPPAGETVRFRHDPGLTFSAGDVSGVALAPERHDDPFAERSHRIYELTTTFLGLTGAMSPLPPYIAEEVLREDDEGPLLRDFLDLFHHRFLSLFYRSVAKFDSAREYTANADDEWSKRVLALTGYDVFGEETRTSLPRWQLLRLAPLLASRARTARTLELALTDVLGAGLEGATVTVEEFIETWMELEAPERPLLGRQHCRLGMDFRLGARVFDRGGRFRVTFRPLPMRAYQRLLPEGDLFRVVKEVVGLMVADPLTYELELVLAAGQRPPFRLSRQGTARLGQNAWLGALGGGETRMLVDVTS